MESFEEHLPRLRRYARALTGNHHAADDLVQDTLERGWSKLSLWRRGSRLDRWLMTIMHNIFINQYRKASLVTEPYDSQPETASRASPEDRLQVQDLQSALKQIPAEHREVLLLVGLEGFSYADTARILGIPNGTVMSRLSRARKQLAALINGGDGATPLRVVK